MTKTFLLGVGAQKAGTTWLHGFLNNHPDCAIGAIKELHAFPTLSERSDNANIHQERLEALRQAIQAVSVAEADTKAQAHQNLERAMDAVSVTMGLAHYLSYFDRVVARHPGALLTGEITPAYSGLEEERFQRLRDALVARGYHVKVLFLMRDPVDRCYSALRMGVRNAFGSAEAYERARRNFGTSAKAEWQEKRTKYDVILPKLERVFPAQDIHYGFYETLFDQGQVDQICDFLGIRRQQANLSVKSNASPKTDSPDPEALKAAAEHYRGAYEFCAQRFGEAFIRQIWPYAALLD